MVGGRELGEARGLGQDIIRSGQHGAVLLALVERIPALHHAADLVDLVVALGKPAAPQDVEQHEGVAGGERVDRERAALVVRDRLYVGDGHEAQEAGVAAHEGEELRLRPDRRLALALDIGDDVVDGGHGDVELAFGESGHLRDRTWRRLHGDADAVLLEQAALLGDVDAPVEAAGEDVDRHLARGLRARRPRERQGGAESQGRAPEIKSLGFHRTRTPWLRRHVLVSLT